MSHETIVALLDATTHIAWIVVGGWCLNTLITVTAFRGHR